MIMKKINFAFVLIGSVILGFALGTFSKTFSLSLKPFGDLFLNLLFTVAVPLVFFSLARSVAWLGDVKKLGKILGWMAVVFILTGVLASLCALAWMRFFPISAELNIPLEMSAPVQNLSFSDQWVRAFSVDNFIQLFSREHMGALILFSLLFGLACNLGGEKTASIKILMDAGLNVMMKILFLVMLYAPVGLTAYFAYLTAHMGAQLTGTYLRIVSVYYPLGFLYFFGAFSLYAWMASGTSGFFRFWENIFTPALTAFATGSSLAAMPVNLQASKKVGIRGEIREMVIPIGATIHMDGSAISAVLKILILFHVFHLPLNGWSDYVGIIGIALLSGTVMSGIPGGGFLGEVLIVNMYGFPQEALPFIAMIGVLVDPLATMINASGDTAAGMLVSRLVDGKNWERKNEDE